MAGQPDSEPDRILETSATTAIVMILIGTSIGMSWIMSYENIPQNISAALPRFKIFI